MPVKKNTHPLMFAVNIGVLVILGLILQIGGAYLVNAAVQLIGGSASPDAAVEYENFMMRVRQMEPRQLVHIMFVAPLVEELVFRLIFLRAGKMLLPFWLANMIQAVLFGIYHGTSVQRVYGAVMGLIIGCVFYYCPLIYRKKVPEGALKDLPDSLMGVAFTFMLHVVINASGLYITPLFPADTEIALQIIFGTLLMAIVVAACFMLQRQTRQDTGV